MTDKLRAAAEMALEALEKTTEAFLDTEGSHGQIENEAWDAAYDAQEALRQALAEPDMGIDRGAWDDVPDATKWVDELRGDEPVAKVCHNLPQHIGWNPKITHLPDEGTPLYAAPQKNEFECPRCGHFCQQVEEPPNSTTDVVEPVAWIVPDYGFLFPNEDSAQRYLDNIESNAAPTPLYTAPPKREWQSLTDEDIAEAVGSPLDEVYLADFRKVEAKLKEKNT